MEILESIFDKVASSRSATLLKRVSGTGLFVQIIWNFQEQLSHRTLSATVSLLSLKLTLNVFKLNSLWKNKKLSSKIVPFKITENFHEKNLKGVSFYSHFLIPWQKSNFLKIKFTLMSLKFSPQKTNCREIDFQLPLRNWNYLFFNGFINAVVLPLALRIPKHIKCNGIKAPSIAAE